MDSKVITQKGRHETSALQATNSTTTLASPITNHLQQRISSLYIKITISSISEVAQLTNYNYCYDSYLIPHGPPWLRSFFGP